MVLQIPLQYFTKCATKYDVNLLCTQSRFYYALPKIVQIQMREVHYEVFRLIFRWASASSVVRHPEDWGNELAAQALSLEPWRNDKWPYTL